MGELHLLGTHAKEAVAEPEAGSGSGVGVRLGRGREERERREGREGSWAGGENPGPGRFSPFIFLSFLSNFLFQTI